MNIKFIGTGGAFDYEYGNSSAILDFKGHTYLIDCGQDIYPRLRSKDFIDPIDHVLITHFHADHVGSLSTFILHHHFFSKGKQLKLLYPDADFKDQLYEYLKFSLQTPEKFIVFVPIKKYPGVNFVDTFGLHVPGMRTYAYYFQDDEEALVYSGDLGDCDYLFDNLPEFDKPKKRVLHDINFDPPVGPHTFYEDLIPYQEDFEIYGYHCDPSKNVKENPVPLVHDHPELQL